MSIKLLIACREETTALALSKQVNLAAEGCLASQSTDLERVLKSASAIRPDVLLLEHTADGEESAWRILTRIAAVSGDTRVLLLCECHDHLTVAGFVQRGASGCLPRSSTPSMIVKAVRTVQQGGTWFGRSELLDALRNQIVTAPVATAEWDGDRLTAREQEILGLIGNALTNKEIARRLKISDKTVKTHLHHIYVKLNRSGRFKALLSRGGRGGIDLAGADTASLPMPHDIRAAPADVFAAAALAFVSLRPVPGSPVSASSEKE